MGWSNRSLRRLIPAISAVQEVWADLTGLGIRPRSLPAGPIPSLWNEIPLACDHFVLSGNLRDTDYLARAVAQARDLDDERDGGNNVLADGFFLNAAYLAIATMDSDASGHRAGC